MKHLFLPLFFLMILFSCKKDKETEPVNVNNNPVKELKVSSSTYTLQNGIIRHSGASGNSYLQKITLLSSGFNLQLQNNTVQSVSGTGNGILIMFYTNSENSITGTFSYSSSGTGTVNTFEYASYGLNYDISAQTGTNKDLNQGTLTITDKGNNLFEVKLTGKDTDNNDINLSYTGSLITFNSDDEYF